MLNCLPILNILSINMHKCFQSKYVCAASSNQHYQNDRRLLDALNRFDFNKQNCSDLPTWAQHYLGGQGILRSAYIDKIQLTDEQQIKLKQMFVDSKVDERIKTWIKTKFKDTVDSQGPESHSPPNRKHIGVSRGDARASADASVDASAQLGFVLTQNPLPANLQVGEGCPPK